MKKTLVAVLAALLVAALAPVARTESTAPMLVRVSVADSEDAEFLFERFDETHNHSASEVELLLWPGDRALLDAAGYTYRVVSEDLFARDQALRANAPIVSVPMPGPDRTDYRRLPDYNAEMREIAEKNKKIAKLLTLPNTTLEGREVLGLEIAKNVKRNDGRPIFYLDALHHAREWPAAEYAMIYAHHLIESYGKDKKITRLLRKARVIIVPLVNPDGFDYSRESVLSAHPTVASATSTMAAGNGFEGYWRKNRRSLTGATVPAAQKNPDAYGVDPNRNYSYLWGDSNGGSSGSQIDQTYRGTAPFSEPETQNVRSIILSRTIAGVITNHTYQATVLRAGGGSAPDDKMLEDLAIRMAKPMNYQSRGSVGYPTTGTTDDWTYEITGTLGFTIEHGRLGFHPPYGNSVLADYKGVMKAFTIMFEAVANRKYHSVIKGTVSDPKAKIVLEKKFKTALSPGNPTGKDSVTEEISIEIDANKNGSFEFHVGPSTRPRYEKGKEFYTLIVSSGGKQKTFDILVNRGQVVDVGLIDLYSSKQRRK